MFVIVLPRASNTCLRAQISSNDSHPFDGVDERQIAGALQLGLEATQAKGLEYIVTMNSDIFARVPFLPMAIDSSKFLLETRLSDGGEEGASLASASAETSGPAIRTSYRATW